MESRFLSPDIEESKEVKKMAFYLLSIGKMRLSAIADKNQPRGIFFHILPKNHLEMSALDRLQYEPEIFKMIKGEKT